MLMKHKTKNNGGFTVLEIVIAATIFAVIIIGAFNVFVINQPFANTTLVKVAVEEKARQIMDRITNDVRKAHLPSITPTAGVTDESSLEFDIITGFADNIADPETGNSITYELRVHPDDPPGNGDDNGNGLIDEQQLIRIEVDKETGEETEIVLTNDVETVNGVGQFIVSHGLDNRIAIRLTLAKRDPNNPKAADDENVVIHRASLETHVFVTNFNEVGGS